MSSRKVSIAVVGSGYVGLVAAVCFAEMGHDVICVDNDARKVAALQAGETLIHELHLPDLLGRHGNTHVRFTTDLADATAQCEAIFIAVGTPMSGNGDADLSYVEAVASEIARSINGYKVLVEKSTVPVYTNEWIRRVMERYGVDSKQFDVVSNPEFLREGTAVEDFLHPDRIVVGSDSERAAKLMGEIYAPLTEGEYYGREKALSGCCSAESLPPILFTTTKSAEIIKHASNSFLAMKISFINAVANMCEVANADISQVSAGMGLDRRIGSRFLQPGIGYGGSCFPKDVAAFRSVAENMGVNFELLHEVERINQQQKTRFLSKVRSALWNLRSKKLGVLGLAFKGETDDIRESPALDIVEMLLAEGCTIAAYDPAASERAAAEMPASNKLSYVDSAYDAADGADALLILTDWDEFRNLDMVKMRSAMHHPIVVDGRNLFEPKKMQQLGFTYLSVGRPEAVPSRQLQPTGN
jgi:UDPglucose 6-dehydrogenase